MVEDCMRKEGKGRGLRDILNELAQMHLHLIRIQAPTSLLLVTLTFLLTSHLLSCAFADFCRNAFSSCYINHQ